MSKRVTVESLTRLRENFRMNIREVLDASEFDFTTIDLQDIDYPEPEDHDLKKFYISFRDNPKDEFSLARILYESLPLTEQQASDNLYWIYLNLKHFFGFIKDRWIDGNGEDNEEKTANLFERFFLALTPSQNNFILSAIAGLWWAIHLSIDTNHPIDKYYYSKIFLSDRNLRNKTIGPYQFIRHKATFQAILEFYDQNKDEEFEDERIGSEVIAQQSSKVLNQIGALTLLSYLTKEEIKEKLDRYKEVILRRAHQAKKGKIVSREKMAKARETSFGDHRVISAGSYVGESRLSSNWISTKEPALEEEGIMHILRYFNLNDDGAYCVTSLPEIDYKYQLPIEKKYENGYLLQCYLEDGNVNRVTIRSLLRRNRLEYKNGLYGGNTLKKLLLIPEEAIIGICYDYKGVRYFKAHLSSQFKDNNSTMHLQGYKTLYAEHDAMSVNFFVLPIELKASIDRLIHKSFVAAGKAIDNPNYKEEFKIIRKHAKDCFSDALRLFE